MHTKGHRCLHVGFAVIDVNSQGRVDCKSLQEKLENAWIRFQQFPFARKHTSLEPLQKLEPLQSGREGLNTPIRTPFYPPSLPHYSHDQSLAPETHPLHILA